MYLRLPGPGARSETKNQMKTISNQTAKDIKTLLESLIKTNEADNNVKTMNLVRKARKVIKKFK